MDKHEEVMNQIMEADTDSKRIDDLYTMFDIQEKANQEVYNVFSEMLREITELKERVNKLENK